MIFNRSNQIKLVAIAVVAGILSVGFHNSPVEAKPSSHSSLNQSNLDTKSSQQSKNLKPGQIQTNFIKNLFVIASSFGGKASWYGPGFHGRLTANGERYNQNAMTAAHRYLRFGTKVKVTNLRNGRSVIVRINDRGPFTKGRVIDLSAAAARSLNMVHSGVAPVQITVLGR